MSYAACQRPGRTAHGLSVVDLDLPQEWPNAVFECAEQVAAQVKMWPEVGNGYPADALPSVDDRYSAEAELKLRHELAGCVVLAYHASRLLPYECDSIRRNGLRVLSDDLLTDKLARAHENFPEALSHDESNLLIRSGQLTSRRARDGRLGRLHVAAPFSVMEGQAHGFLPLLKKWGGEALGWTVDATSEVQPATDCIARLSALSAPSIVEVGFTIDAIPEQRQIWPLAVGSILRLADRWTAWAVHCSLGPDAIIDVIQPDSDRWPSYFSKDRTG
jgi:hypothetical protein